MTVQIDMGTDAAGKIAAMDLEELLATRLLVQGNSGSGKSHLLRRLIEGSAPWVQQVILDPEGEFVNLAERFNHSVVQAADCNEAQIVSIASRIRTYRVSVILDMEPLDADAQMKCAAAFLNALFDAPREHWYPALVVVDEAQLFAPAAAGEVSEEARRASLGAMTNLMCRGRKRGLAGILATQRLAKLAKNVAAEASNFLMGRTFLDIDMARAADLLGMERRQAEMIRDLERGHFLALGPALSKRPLAIRIGAVETAPRGVTSSLIPLPDQAGLDLKELLFEQPIEPLSAPPSHPVAIPSPEELIKPPVMAETAIDGPAHDTVETDRIVDQVLRDIMADADSGYRSAAALFQDFTVRCRMKGLTRSTFELPDFTRRIAMARAGIFATDEDSDDWAEALAVGMSLREDMLGVFLLIARAAKNGAGCPSEEEVARVYGTQSIGRAKRLLSYMESQDIFVTRTDFRGRRSITIPRLGWSTAAEEAVSQRHAETGSAEMPSLF